MRKYLFTVFIIGIVALLGFRLIQDAMPANAAGFLAGYSYRQPLAVITSSTAPGANYVPSIRISNLANPIQSSTYTVNSKTYHYRIQIILQD